MMKMLLHAMVPSVLLLAGVPMSAEAQVTQQQIARQLLSQNRAEQFRGLGQAEAIDPGHMRQPLRAALIQALERENAAYSKQREAMRGGVRYEEGDDFHAQITQTVIALRDPQTIPALAGALGNGLMAVWAITAFGEQAAPAVLDVATSRRSHSSLTNGALIALRFMVEDSRTRPLTSGTVEDVRRVAEQRLTGEQDVTTLWRAIDLAVVLDHPGLRKLVESIAADRKEVIARGVRDPDLIRQTQQIARDRLAGVPPLPRPR